MPSLELPTTEPLQDVINLNASEMLETPVSKQRKDVHGQTDNLDRPSEHLDLRRSEHARRPPDRLQYYEIQTHEAILLKTIIKCSTYPIVNQLSLKSLSQHLTINTNFDSMDMPLDLD